LAARHLLPDQNSRIRERSFAKSPADLLPASDDGMTARRVSDLALSADFSGWGTFSYVGVIRQPSLALRIALSDCRRDRSTGIDKRPFLIHALAKRIGGLCVLESDQVERLEECFGAGLIAEWIVTFPKIGALRALFVIARLKRATQDGLFDIVLHLAGAPSFHEVQTEDADAQ
jgi:hypothetical protein